MSADILGLRLCPGLLGKQDHVALLPALSSHPFQTHLAVPKMTPWPAVETCPKSPGSVLPLADSCHSSE